MLRSASVDKLAAFREIYRPPTIVVTGSELSRVFPHRAPVTGAISAATVRERLAAAFGAEHAYLIGDDAGIIPSRCRYYRQGFAIAFRTEEDAVLAALLLSAADA